jgi:hypothetical protein
LVCERASDLRKSREQELARRSDLKSCKIPLFQIGLAGNDEARMAGGPCRRAVQPGPMLS